MERYLARKNRETRFKKINDRMFEIFISNIPNMMSIGTVAILMLIIAGLGYGILEMSMRDAIVIHQ